MRTMKRALSNTGKNIGPERSSRPYLRNGIYTPKMFLDHGHEVLARVAEKRENPNRTMPRL